MTCVLFPDEGGAHGFEGTLEFGGLELVDLGGDEEGGNLSLVEEVEEILSQPPCDS